MFLRFLWSTSSLLYCERLARGTRQNSRSIPSLVERVGICVSSKHNIMRTRLRSGLFLRLLSDHLARWNQTNMKTLSSFSTISHGQISSPIASRLLSATGRDVLLPFVDMYRLFSSVHVESRRLRYSLCFKPSLLRLSVYSAAPSHRLFSLLVVQIKAPGRASANHL